MASRLGRSVLDASDAVYDYACSPCEEDKKNAEALFYCDSCKKLYCKPCIELHNKLFKSHSVLGKDKMQQWGVVKRDNDFEMCVEHKNENLKMFCQDHDAICCTVCVSVGHRTCKVVKHLPDVARGFRENSKFKQLPTQINKTKLKVNNTREAKKKVSKELKDSRTDMMSTLQKLRRNVNQMFDEIEKKTITIMDGLLSEANTTVQNDIKTCTKIHDSLQKLMDNIQDQGQNSDTVALIGYRISQDQVTHAENLIDGIASQDQKITFQEDKNIQAFISNIDTFGTFLSAAGPTRNTGTTNVGSDHVYSVQGSQKHTVRVSSDDRTCDIRGMCQLPNGNIAIVDNINGKVKLLNESYTVIDQCDPSGKRWHICHIKDNELVMTLGDGLQFIVVENGKIKLTRKINIDHKCYEVAQHNGQLYVASDTALYLYTIAGKMIKKLYEDTSGGTTVNTFALSDDGSMIYVGDHANNLLVTLDNNGNKLWTLGNKDLETPVGVCVAGNGTVFICGFTSNTVIQVNREGKRKLSTVARKSDGIKHPWSLWFNRRTSQLIVGLYDNDNILALNMK